MSAGVSALFQRKTFTHTHNISPSILAIRLFFLAVCVVNFIFIITVNFHVLDASHFFRLFCAHRFILNNIHINLSDVLI